MSGRLPPGPYRTLQLADGGTFPFYIIPFDKRGLCTAPATREHLIDALTTDDVSDVFLFSHGWNNDWTVATRRYEHFIEGYMEMRRQQALPTPAGYKPLLVGVFWPSTALVFTEKEKGPQLAANQPEVVDEAIAEERAELDAVAEDLDDDWAQLIYVLGQKRELSENEARQLAELAKSFYNLPDDELGLDTALSTDDLIEIWSTIPSEQDELAEFIAGGNELGVAGIGSFLKKLDPRKVVRTLTVLKMKDRAGKIGRRGVSELLRDMLAANTSTRTHLVGHSYGGKVVLSATCADSLPRKVHSMLLLQPAVSHLCFAEQVPTTNHPGGYRGALDRVDRPILSTFSKHDFPLTKLFHLAVRRSSDLGEVDLATAGDDPVSKYAALGGFGPRKAGERFVSILDPGTPYELDEAVGVYGVNGSRTIAGHGDISVPSTWWALNQLVSD